MNVMESVLRHMIGCDPYSTLDHAKYIARLFNLKEEDEDKDTNRLGVDFTVTTSSGVAVLINARRPEMWSLGIFRSDTIDGEILYELLDDAHHKDAQSVELKPGITRIFTPNTVLTEVHLIHSVLIKDTAAEILL
ncbi:hypothetical protein BGZ51_001445, partial [Haplosporangium sp. Z 767]